MRLGLKPLIFLKTLQKYAWSRNPVATETSLTDIPVFFRRLHASHILYRFR
jgi:hypothetical protein